MRLALPLALLLAGLLAFGCGPSDQPAPAVATTPPTSPTQPRTLPVQPDASVTIVVVQGAAPGGIASVTAQTTPEALCNVQYTAPFGLITTAPGLSTEAADTQGKVTWTWAIKADSRTGPGKIRVNCNGAEATADVPIG